jgi:hypothetical protein
MNEPPGIPPDGRLDAVNAARYLGRSPKTLAQWRLHGKGPPVHKIGGRVFYYRDELDAFIAAEGGVNEPSGIPPDRTVLDADHAAWYIGCRTLAQWQLHGKGPPAHEIAGRVVYYSDEVDAFIIAEGR